MATHAPITGAPCRAPIPYRSNLFRPDTIDSAPLLEMAEQTLAATGMKPTRFGRNAVRDPWLVRDLRAGKAITHARQAKILAFMREGR